MKRMALTLAVGVALLAGCAKDGGRAGAAASDSAANAAADAPAPGAPTGIGGAPAYARQGVDSSNAMQQQRLNEVNELSDQASGAKP